MKTGSARRRLGLLGGVALIGFGAGGIFIDRSNYDNPQIQPFCRVGLCPDQFSPERVFEISQKAALGDPRGQVEQFKEAVRLSPSSAYRWADLGEAESIVRDYERAEYAFSRALQLGPRSPVILVRAANMEFQLGNARKVLKYFAALLSDPLVASYYDTAFLSYSRLGIPLDQILESIPQRSEVLSKLLTFWTRVNKTDEAIKTWKWADSRSLASGQSMDDFFTFLIKAGQQVTAQQLWQEYACRLEPHYRVTNYIYNSSFETKPLLSPFDWTIETGDSAEASRSQDSVTDGSWSLRIRFNGQQNTDYQQTYQDLVLEPGHYGFSAMMKTQQLRTDEGLRIHIFDQPTQARLNVWTDTLTGDQEWTKIEGAVNVPAGVKIVRVQVARKPSTKFDNKIGGTAWIDKLQLFRQ